MMNKILQTINIGELISSKKFKVMAAIVSGILLLALANGELTQADIDNIIQIVSVYLGAQGIGDVGKYVGQYLSGKS